MKSWRKEMKTLLVVILLFMVGFILFVNIQSYMRISTEYKEENERTAEMWVEVVASRLTTMHEHLSELMILIYGNVELREGSPIMQYEMRTKCINMMDDKTSINSDFDCIFVLDKQDNVFLFSSSRSMPLIETVKAKELLQEEALATTSTNDTAWSVMKVNDGYYFVRLVSLGKYVVGGMSRFSKYDISKTMNVLGEENSSLFLYEDEFLHISGSNWENTFFLDAQGCIATEYKGVAYTENKLSRTNGTFILAARQFLPWESLVASISTLLIAGAICLLLYTVLAIKMNRMIGKPTKILLEAMETIKSGDMSHQITQKPDSIEFQMLFNSFNEMSKEIQTARIEVYETELQKQKDELTLLSAQIRPHFFLNAITTVSNMTYLNKPEDIRNYLSNLAKYIRYMLRMKSRMVTIGEELSHINNYIQMQKIKFPESIEAYIGCSKEVENMQIPYLLLFSVIENTFKHAMSLYSQLVLFVQCEYIEQDGFSGVRIAIEDNGEGFSPETLQDFAPEGKMPSAKNHFGLSNVSRTLQLVYNQKGLLRLSNSESGGAHVELWIPNIVQEDSSQQQEEK